MNVMDNRLVIVARLAQTKVRVVRLKPAEAKSIPLPLVFTEVKHG